MSLQDFKNSEIKYVYDNENKVYSVKVMFKGKPMILTMRVGKDVMDMTLTDMSGKEIEYIGQNKKQLAYRRDEKLASEYRQAAK